MPTKPIRPPDDEFKAHVAAYADRAGISARGPVPEASEAAQVERQNEFDAEADERYANLPQRGGSIVWSQMRRYLDARYLSQAADS